MNHCLKPDIYSLATSIQKKAIVIVPRTPTTRNLEQKNKKVVIPTPIVTWKAPRARICRKGVCVTNLSVIVLLGTVKSPVLVGKKKTS